MVRPVSVVLIREWPEQVTGSGCCGKVEGDQAFTGASATFSHSCQIQQRFGTLHRAVRQLFTDSQAQVVTVDPRNQLYLIGRLMYDVCVGKPGWVNGLRTILQCFSVPAVVVDGTVLPGGADVTPDMLCHAISEKLGIGTADMDVAS